MTCKDCYHYEKCYFEALKKSHLTGSDYRKIVCIDNQIICKFFKDKSLIIELPCKVGQIVYDVVLCDDDIYRIFEMKTSAITPFGSLYESTNRPPFLWNIYLTDNYSYAYRVFSDIGKKIFFDKSEAEARLKELNGKE